MNKLIIDYFKSLQKEEQENLLKVFEKLIQERKRGKEQWIKERKWKIWER